MAQKRIFFIDLPGHKALPDGSMVRIAGALGEITSVTDAAAAITALNAGAGISIVVCNNAHLEIFQLIRQLHPHAKIVLITDETMEKYSSHLGGAEDQFVDHVIANRAPTPWTLHEFRITLQKIIRGDIFGLEKYMAPGAVIQHLTVHGSADRENYNSQVMAFADNNRLGHYMSKLAFGISEELLMNAIYDAPIAAGRTHYGELPRTSAIELAPDEYSTLSFSCDGTVLGISIADPFGALKRDKLFQYLKKVVKRADSANLIDTKKGGAGLGFFKILYSSHALVVNVHPGQRTEVMALIDIEHQVRDFSKMARSIHYFQAE